MKIRFEVERTFPLEQFANIKPRIVIEHDLKDGDDPEAFLKEAEGLAMARISEFKNRFTK